MPKHPFMLNNPTFRSLQLKSKPGVIQLSLYSLKHDQVQSLQEAEHPCQQQYHSLSLKHYSHATAIYPGLWHALMECLVPWESAPVRFSKTKKRLHLLKIAIPTGEQGLILIWSWWTWLQLGRRYSSLLWKILFRCFSSKHTLFSTRLYVNLLI